MQICSIEGLVNDQNAEVVAGGEEGGRSWIVAGANGVEAIGLEEFDAALLGAVVIVSIANGMDLLALDSSVKFIVTGAVLVAAVTIESVTRLRRHGGAGR